MKYRVFVASRSFGRFVDDGIRLLSDEAVVIRNPHGRALNSEELGGSLRDADGALLGNDVCDSEVLNSAEKLKVVSRHGVGVDNVDLEAATENGIIVANTPSVNKTAVAEHTMALILSLLRKIPQADASLKSGKWEGPKFMGSELAGKKLGIVGLGAIGTEVAKRAKCFGMNVLYLKRRRREDLEKELGIVYRPLEQLLRESDIVSIHLPLTRETKGMIGEREIALMNKDAYLINTARGEVLDDAALAEALMEERIAGAALDVFSKEPPDSDHPLFQLDNVILTPHVGAYTLEAVRKMDLISAENIVRVFHGQQPDFVVNKEVLSRSNLRLRSK
jgi:D-3-phosphoglycerate dehydrogenase